MARAPRSPTTERTRCAKPVTAQGDEVYFYDHTGARVLTYRTNDGGKTATLRHRFGSVETTTDTAGDRSAIADLVVSGHALARVTNHDTTTPETLYMGALGNLLAALDVNKVLRAQYGYGPLGELLYASGPDAPSYDHTYEDKARDALTGLSYFGARYYDPLTATWTQADPLYRMAPDFAYDEPRRMSPFTYVLNSPLRYVDPDGHDSKTPFPSRSQPTLSCNVIDGCLGWSDSSGGPADNETPSSDSSASTPQFDCGGPCAGDPTDAISPGRRSTQQRRPRKCSSSSSSSCPARVGDFREALGHVWVPDSPPTINAPDYGPNVYKDFAKDVCDRLKNGMKFPGGPKNYDEKGRAGRASRTRIRCRISRPSTTCAT